MVGHQLEQQKLTYQYYSTIFLLMRLFQRVTAESTYVEHTLTVQSHTDTWTVSEQLLCLNTNSWHVYVLQSGMYIHVGRRRSR